jgi:hypothetical protein
VFGIATASAATMLTPQGSTLGSISHADDNFEVVSLTDGCPAGLNFGGAHYTTMSVGTNGYVTFGHSNSSYDPQGIAGYNEGPIVAVQFDDIDTTSKRGLHVDNLVPPQFKAFIYLNDVEDNGSITYGVTATEPLRKPIAVSPV